MISKTSSAQNDIQGGDPLVYPPKDTATRSREVYLLFSIFILVLIVGVFLAGYLVRGSGKEADVNNEDLTNEMEEESESQLLITRQPTDTPDNDISQQPTISLQPTNTETSDPSTETPVTIDDKEESDNKYAGWQRYYSLDLGIELMYPQFYQFTTEEVSRNGYDFSRLQFRHIDQVASDHGQLEIAIFEDEITLDTYREFSVAGSVVDMAGMHVYKIDGNTYDMQEELIGGGCYPDGNNTIEGVIAYRQDIGNKVLTGSHTYISSCDESEEQPEVYRNDYSTIQSIIESIEFL